MTQAEWLASEDPATMLARWTSPAHWYKVFGGVAPSDRKLRLFACACCRQVWHLLTDDRSRRVVEVAELFADGLATEGELRAAWRTSTEVQRDFMPIAAGFAALPPQQKTCNNLSDFLTFFGSGEGACPPTAQAALLREIVGNPFRRTTLGFPLSWLIRNMAGRIYDERDWEALPILADALEEAGCPQDKECLACVGQGGHICVGGEQRAEPANAMSANDYHAGTEDAWRWETRTAWWPCKMCNGTKKVLNVLLAHLHSPGPHVRGCWAVDLLLGKE